MSGYLNNDRVSRYADGPRPTPFIRCIQSIPQEIKDKLESLKNKSNEEKSLDIEMTIHSEEDERSSCKLDE